MLKRSARAAVRLGLGRPRVRRLVESELGRTRRSEIPELPELRKDPITGRWVIIATDRAKRPSDFVRQMVPPPATAICPFDYGNEHKTPPEVLAYRTSGSATSPAGGCAWCPINSPCWASKANLNRQGEGMYDKMNGIGAHEVIIEGPEHDKTLGGHVRKADRGSAVGFQGPRQRLEEGPALSDTSSSSRITAMPRAHRWNILTRS